MHLMWRNRPNELCRIHLLPCMFATRQSMRVLWRCRGRGAAKSQEPSALEEPRTRSLHSCLL